MDRTLRGHVSDSGGLLPATVLVRASRNTTNCSSLSSLSAEPNSVRSTISPSANWRRVPASYDQRRSLSTSRDVPRGPVSDACVIELNGRAHAMVSSGVTVPWSAS